MARRKKRKRRARVEEEEIFGIELNPETKRGIIVVILFAAAAILILSLFNIAGTLGTFLNTGMAGFLGWDRFLLPLVFIILAASILFPERKSVGTWNYIGILFFFISFNALSNLIMLRNTEATIENLQKAGGYLGQFLGTLLPSFVGFWASIVILLSFIVVSLLLVFNTSLSNLMRGHTYVTNIFKTIFSSWKRDDSDYEYDDEEEIEDEEVDEEEMEDIEVEEADEEETKKLFSSKKIKNNTTEVLEKALTSKKRRKRIQLSVELLEHRSTKVNSGDIDRNREIIRKTFEHFGIEVEMCEISVGPTVTQFTLRPASGVKLSRIVSLQNDLALALAAHPIRIEAPIPGKSLVGIEIPNQTVATVSLRELLESKVFKKRTTDSDIVLGKDVSGKVWSAALEKMPHLLVAGATGSGKSVCLNTIITTLLYENGPDDMRFIMVDPKRVELTAYDGIPHLLVPPIVKVDDTINALKWTVREMERRLDVISKVRARDIVSYNQKAEEQMPRIVVVIDELADVMAASGHEVESTIVRIAQMARAAGIHLILATQRPSVDVITGTIKANFPSRIAFAVASQTDSRTILDCAGAEKLLGRGDMLYSSAQMSKPKRIQGAYVSEDEVRRVVKALKGQSSPDYNYVVTEKQKSGSILDSSSGDDDLIEEAAQIVVQAEKASTSFLQRRLRIGYSRAARLMDILEEQGVIGEPNGSKAREVLINEWPPGGDFSDGMPTDQDNLDEAEEEWDGEPEEEEKDDESENDDEEVEWEEVEENEEEGEDEESENDDELEEDEEEDFEGAQKGEYLDE